MSGDLSEFDLAQEALADEYEIIEELGRGGMAIVYRARERQLDREVAVKVLPLSLAFDEEFVQRFEQEARTSAQLEHPNIIPIYRVGQSGRVSYFVMKFLRGRSLSDLLAERGRLKPAEIKRMLIETAGALGYASARGVVHRDVKPDNFIFDEHGVCVVTDFGIAKAASAKRLTGTGMSIGTPHYMSPEQARAQALDGRSDLYSLGIVAYQCLTGTVPYDGEDSFSIGYAHIMDPLPNPTLVSFEERELYRVIRGMMAKDPKDRFQTCEEVVLALKGEAPVPMEAPDPAPGRAGQPSPTVPAMTTQPTTPLPALGATGPRTASAMTATPTRRPAALRTSAKKSAAGWWLTGLVVLGSAGAGAAYAYKVGPFAEFVSSALGRPSLDSMPPVPVLTALDSTAGDSSTVGGPVAVDDTAITPGPAVVGTPTRPASASRDSGAIRIRGLPAGSAVLIDGNPAVSALTYLSVGDHIIAITAPRHHFYADTIGINHAEIVDYQPTLTPVGQPVRGGRQTPAITRRRADCDQPSQDYNRNNACYDVRPRPVGPTFVTVPASWAELPSSTRLLIRVSTQGKTLEVRGLRPSDNREFEALARQFAAGIDWHPATKDGVSVMGWTPWEFRPVQ
jgi:predicted Ser/Thr protein kinase